MSTENIIAFGEQIKNSTELQAEVQALGGKLAEIVSLAGQKGFDFSMDELKVQLLELQPGTQLEDSDLEQVAGGEIEPPWDTANPYLCPGGR
jgi:predicted ribosomally synthesized peptide with nif11-like leader